MVSKEASCLASLPTMLASHFVFVIELTTRKFYGCTVVRTLCFHCPGPGFRELRSQKLHGMNKNNDDDGKIKQFVIEEADLKIKGKNI